MLSRGPLVGHCPCLEEDPGKILETEDQDNAIVCDQGTLGGPLPLVERVFWETCGKLRTMIFRTRWTKRYPEMKFGWLQELISQPEKLAETRKDTGVSS